MKCQILFSGKNKKNISKCRLLKFLPRVLSVKVAVVERLLYIFIKPVMFCYHSHLYMQLPCHLCPLINYILLLAYMSN